MRGLSIKINRLMKQRPWTSQKGAAAVELAIVFFLLMLFIFGMIEFSLYLYNRHVITNAAREGARYGVVSRPERYHNDEIIQKVIDYSQQHLVTFGATDILDVTILPEYVGDPDDFNPNDSRCTDFEIVTSDGTKIRCELKVTVQYPYDFLFLKLPPLSLNPQPIKSVAKMKME